MSATTEPEPGRRRVGWLLVVLGELAGAAAGAIALGTLVSTALDGSGRSSPAVGLGVTLLLLLVGIALGAVAARRLGVHSAAGRAAFAALVAVSGFVSLWVVAIVAGRLSA